VPFMLALTGLPTLFPKLVEARTFSERMFRVVFLNPLDKEDTKAAILKPIDNAECPIAIAPESVNTIWSITQGYPYFIQYVCREVYDVWVQATQDGKKEMPRVPVNELMRKLDTDFFSGRWARATDRQRELLSVISQLENADGEFTVQEIVELSVQKLEKSFSASHVNQMLSSLSDAGLIYKNRHGKYSYAVPLMSGFIKRQNVA